jgi:hypothetical protein
MFVSLAVVILIMAIVFMPGGPARVILAHRSG